MHFRVFPNEETLNVKVIYKFLRWHDKWLQLLMLDINIERENVIISFNIKSNFKYKLRQFNFQRNQITERIFLTSILSSFTKISETYDGQESKKYAPQC